MANIFGNNTNNTLPGTANPDNIFGRGGNDQLSGLAGNDRLNGGVGNDLLNGGLGIDTADYSTGVLGEQSFIDARNGVIVNLAIAGAQNTGGAGNDQLMGIENLTGSSFNDALAGNSVNNLLSGLAGNDILAGAAGTDQLLGKDGNDRLNGGLGNDLLNGGLGSDTADYGTFIIGGQTVAGASNGVTVNLNLPGAQNTGGAGSDTLVSIENLTGSNFNDTLTGNSANNVLTGRAGNDILNGGNGNDTLQGDSGNDTLNGGDGIDTASYSTATAGVTVNVNDIGGQSTGGGGLDQLVSIENVTGSNFNDTLETGNFAEEGSTFTLNGGLGNDSLNALFSSGNLTTLNGGVGNDGLYGHFAHSSTLNGDAGDDSLFVVDSDFTTLNGGTGNDRLVNWDGFVVALNGGAGNDTLIEGSDFGGTTTTMTGGTGADTLNNDSSAVKVTFDYNAVSESSAGMGKDTILGFTGASAGLGDQIDLTDTDANALLAGNQAFTYIGSAAFTAAGQLRYTGGVLQGSTDADATAEFEIQLIGAPTLSVGGVGTDILL